jgi:hypothetical protein
MASFDLVDRHHPSRCGHHPWPYGTSLPSVPGSGSTEDSSLNSWHHLEFNFALAARRSVQHGGGPELNFSTCQVSKVRRLSDP